ncbi:MAG: DUF4194 domain-containing protein [Terrimicrobiaceae bacterium]|jgi:hypothetical protein
MGESILPLTEHDRTRLGEALRALLAHGSIPGLEGGSSEIYHWAFQNQDLLRETASLLHLDLRWEHENRLLIAVPEGSDFLLRLKLDATLVLLVLWYEYDTAVRDRAESPPIRIPVRALNDSLETKFKPLRRHLLARGRLREILALAERKNLVRIEPAPDFELTVISILPTLKSVIPFQDIAEWNAHAAHHLAATNPPEAPDDTTAADDEPQD